MLAIGGDGYGNLVLMRLSDGSVEWWPHERPTDDVQTTTICRSFADYLDLIAKGEV